MRDCLMAELGTVEKQIAGVFIAKARGIVLRHLTIHDVPRAAININDNMWGGHVVEWCDVFNTCLESREHGAFNSWGRDRHWMRMKGEATPAQFARLRDLARLDAVEITTLRYNRFQCANGYDIDLDDGSTHYLIENNLCLQGGIKLREGFFRIVRNNISPLFSPHVWYPDSRDVVTNNILVGQNAYDPRGMTMDRARDGIFDFNLFAAYTVPEDLRRLGFDRHSLTADPRFVAPASGDFRVQPGSPAERLGFANFPMDRFGVISPALKARAKTWAGLGQALSGAAEIATVSPLHHWLGATLRDLVNRGRESSVVGNMELSDNRGILIKAVAADSLAARAGLPADAVIVAANELTIGNLAALSSIIRESGAHPLRLKILAATGYLEVSLAANGELPRPEAADAPPATRRRDRARVK
ncbi:MAG: PDZ domain-containing protein [Verrucomicrobia bacterium]|nr:PDZ domain-containing protein [Verrucomicrobiota bacterium]